MKIYPEALCKGLLNKNIDMFGADIIGDFNQTVDSQGGAHSALGGCSAFLVSSALGAYFNGKDIKKTSQEELRNTKEFQEEMRFLQSRNVEERFCEELAFKKTFAATVRKQQIEVAKKSFEARLDLARVKYFLKTAWPLSYSFFKKMMTELTNFDLRKEKLHVILMRPSLSDGEKCKFDEDELFESIERSVAQSCSNLKLHLDFHIGECNKSQKNGGNASLMNIFFLLSPLPVLVVSPHYDVLSGTLHFNVALWNGSTPRPLIRHLFKIPFKASDFSVEEFNKITDAIVTIIGSINDSYRWCYCCEPMNFYQQIKDNNSVICQRISSYKDLPYLSFIEQEIENLKLFPQFAKASIA